MINSKDFRDLVVRPTLEAMEDLWPGASRPAAVNLMVGIAAKESTIRGETYLKQVGGPALGIFQIEPATHADLWDTYLLYPSRLDKAVFMRDLLSVEAPSDEEAMHHELIYNLRYATAVARLKLWRCSFQWPEDPDDVEALGAIWDEHYNANPDHGTVAEFVEKYPL